MANRSPPGTRQVWADQIDRFDQDGQTVAQFCAADGVSQPSFHQCRRKLRHEASAKQRFGGFFAAILSNGSQARLRHLTPRRCRC